MNIKRIVLAVFLAAGLTTGVVWLLGDGLAVRAAPVYGLQVCPSGCAFSSIQDAVDAAAPGELIQVATGVYTGVHARGGVTQVVYISKTVTVRGGYNADFSACNPISYPTTLDAQGQGRVIWMSGSITPVIEGLRITGGNAYGLGGTDWGDNAGGGIFVVSATASISGNVIYSNTGGSDNSFGGGLYLKNSAASLTHNTITSNTAAHGDGMYLFYSPASLSHNIISGNGSGLTGWGGGVALRHSDANLTDNTITGNRGGYGGGVNMDRGEPLLNHNIITGNTGFDGGGLFLYVSNARLTNNLVQGNVANQNGGGLWLYKGTPAIINTVVADNHLTQDACFGTGIYIEASSVRLLHTTIARNTGGDGSGLHITGYEYSGSYYPGTVAITNTLIVNHGVGITVTAGNTATLNATLWHSVGTKWSDNVVHANDHEGDPAFAADGYHLTASSAAINKGVNADVTSDIDGELRPQDGGYDLGADEVKAEFKLYLPLVLRNRN
ncbi:MAG TPA: choice-of-anchor Q domain-containing protein [Anaerolineae bacterium]|nr:choice-of-anchor Q domain-containing protein [Anaerolineae bacterium]HQI84890.1 choice-of-anchor Q domain-containing protein [Anaerolineae bacterium]